MKTYLNLILISLGLIIASLLIQYTNITTNQILISSIVIMLSSLVLSFFSHQSRPSNEQPNKIKIRKNKPLTVNSNNKEVKGKVKWFNKTKGFGFITQDNGNDIFVHQTSIAFKPSILKEGQAITFNVVIDDKGPQAENVRRA